MKVHGEKLAEKPTDKNGFTLVELVLAVAIMSIMSALGFVGYQSYLTNQENRSTELAAQSVLLDAMSAHRDFDEKTTVEKAVEEWKNTTGKGLNITVDFEETEGCVRIKVTNGNGYTSEREDGFNCDGESIRSFPPAEPETDGV